MTEARVARDPDRLAGGIPEGEPKRAEPAGPRHEVDVSAEGRLGHRAPARWAAMAASRAAMRVREGMPRCSARYARLTGPAPKQSKLWKVILLNDDFTPRDVVTGADHAVFAMSEAEALGVMLSAHREGACVVAVCTGEVATRRPGSTPD